jgi:RecA-family ATPase
LTGINSGTGISGTTAWHNSVRSRFYMTAPKLEQGEQPDTDLRELQFKKSNYGPISNSITLRCQNGLFLPEGGTSSLDKLALEQKAEEVFLALLTRFEREDRNVNEKPSSHTYAPAMFHKEREAKGLRKEQLEGAMRRLFEADKIHIAHYGRPSRPASRLKVVKKEEVGSGK